MSSLMSAAAGRPPFARQRHSSGLLSHDRPPAIEIHIDELGRWLRGEQYHVAMLNGTATNETAPTLSFWIYVWEWIKLTFAGTKGFIGDVGLVLALVVAWAHARWPKDVEALMTRVVPATAGYEDSVAFAPLYVAGGYLVIRALLAPFWLARRARREHDEERVRLEADLTAERKASNETIEALQRRVAQLEAPAPRVLVRATGDSEGPLALKNVGAVEAHNVRIRDLVYETDYVEFDVIDPLETDGTERVPDFRVMAGRMTI
jgi:hypothetical protein